ncbi:MAG: hypothetical protein KAI70_00500 [Candidatus Omnitrophica bacterium]|nr:hypothetical protein [Candidatus Omnitrophota bacterium]
MDQFKKVTERAMEHIDNEEYGKAEKLWLGVIKQDLEALKVYKSRRARAMIELSKIKTIKKVRENAVHTEEGSS